MNYDQWRKWWVDRAPEYFTDKIWKFSQPDLIKKLNIQQQHLVLEIGFGYGRELSQFCKLSSHVFGLELTDWACENTLIELNKRGVSSLPTLKSYAGIVIPFSAGIFNVIYSCFVIQHLSHFHAKELCSEALTALTKDGLVLFEFFGDPEYYDNGNDVFSGIDGQGGMFNNAYIPSEIISIIESIGGKLHWLETKLITKEWGNHWVCFGRAN